MRIGSTTNVFEGKTDDGNTILIDADAPHTHGPSPMELVLMALCSCTSVDVVSILRKKRQDLTGSARQRAPPFRLPRRRAFSPTSSSPIRFEENSAAKRLKMPSRYQKTNTVRYR